MTTAAPLVKMLDEHPSTHRRVRMSHKFGMLAINKAGKVYLTANIQDKNSKFSCLLVLCIFNEHDWEGNLLFLETRAIGYGCVGNKRKVKKI